LVTPTHLTTIRQTLPATATQIYLNNATAGPLPACVPQAIQTRMQEEWQYGRLGTAAGYSSKKTIASQARNQVARLLHANEDEIALTVNTSQGLNIVCHGIDWQANDEVIVTNHEHMGSLAPLYQIRDRAGIVIKIADLGEQANRPLRPAIEALLTPRTRLIVLPHVTWTTGAVLDIQAIGKLGQEYHIPILVDGAQSAGAIDINVHELGVDFYAIPMQKWLCGPDGTGALYVRRSSLSFIAPTFVGLHSVAPGEHNKPWDNARRFELGGHQTAIIAGQCAALRWLENEVTYEWIFQHISKLNTYAYHALKAVAGITILTPQPGASGIFSFLVAGQDTEEIAKRLQHEYTIYIRSIPERKILRFSTGFYNTEEEIDALTHALSFIVPNARTI
jgi:L-cysteine/cystine lyase